LLRAKAQGNILHEIRKREANCLIDRLLKEKKKKGREGSDKKKRKKTLEVAG
jgi:hypothetical protein